MKKRTIMVSVLVTMLSGCAGWGLSGGGASGSSESEENKPYSQRVLKPGDIYYGG